MGLRARDVPLRAHGRLQRAAALSPAIDVDEDDDGYTICVELPGVSKEDVDVGLEGNLLTIRGDKREEKRGEGKGRRRWTERSYGAFERSFTLPSDADAEGVDATFRDGVLRIELKKSEASKPKSISVK